MKRLGAIAGGEDAMKIRLHAVSGLNRVGGTELDAGFRRKGGIGTKTGGQDNDVACDGTGTPWFDRGDTFAEREIDLKALEMIPQTPRELRVIATEHINIGVDHGNLPCVRA